ncbi:hypothetical protein [[Actinomadura] parvosata]|nr:hypothetical protein [Nonomuraea sp. ATCC 55076]
MLRDQRAAAGARRLVPGDQGAAARARRVVLNDRRVAARTCLAAL